MEHLNLDKMLAMARLAFREALYYRAEMMISIFTGPISMLVYYIIWKSVYSAAGTDMIAGYTFTGMITYYAMTMLTFYWVWDDTAYVMSEQVRTGEFINHILKPIQAWRLFIYGKIGSRALAGLIEFLPQVVILWVFFGINIFSAYTQLPYYFISLACAFVIWFEIEFIMGSVSFVMIRNSGLRRFVTWLIPFFAGGYFPLALLPEMIGKIFFVLPFPWILFGPISAYLGVMNLGGFTLGSWQIIGCQLLYIAVLYVVMVKFYEHTVKHFTGVGA